MGPESPPCITYDALLYVWASADFFKSVGFDLYCYAAGVASGAIALIVTHAPWSRLWRS